MLKYFPEHILNDSADIKKITQSLVVVNGKLRTATQQIKNSKGKTSLYRQDDIKKLVETVGENIILVLTIASKYAIELPPRILKRIEQCDEEN